MLTYKRTLRFILLKNHIFAGGLTRFWTVFSLKLLKQDHFVSRSICLKMR